MCRHGPLGNCCTKLFPFCLWGRFFISQPPPWRANPAICWWATSRRWVCCLFNLNCLKPTLLPPFQPSKVVKHQVLIFLPVDPHLRSLKSLRQCHEQSRKALATCAAPEGVILRRWMRTFQVPTRALYAYVKHIGVAFVHRPAFSVFCQVSSALMVN